MTPLKTALQTPQARAAIILLAAAGVYGNTLFNSFVYDDLFQVLNNPWLRDPHSIGRIFSTGAWGFNATETNYYRPLMHVFYMLIYAFFELEPLGYHLANIVFHALNSVLAFLLASEITRKADCDLTGLKRYIPFMTGIIFAIHPIHTEAVAWIGGIPDLSFSFFFLLSLYLYILSEKKEQSSAPWLLAASAGSFFAATLCKEPAVMLPLVILLYDLLFNRSSLNFSFSARRYSPYFIILLIYFVLRWNALDGFSPVNKHDDLTLFQAILNIFPLFAKYVYLLLVPVNLNAWHAFHSLKNLYEMRLLVSLGIAFSFLAFSLYTAKTNKILFFCLCFFIIPLLPALYIPGTGENPFAERYLYLPSFGFALLFSLLVGKLFSVRSYGKVMASVLATAVCVLYAAQTFSRNFDWKDDLTFWSVTAGKSPDEPLPRYNLGAALERQGNLDAAMEQYRQAIALQPASVAHRALGHAYYLKGRKSETVLEYAKALEIDPENSELHNETGIVLMETGRHDQAVNHFLKAVELVPDNPELRYNLAMALRKNNGIPEAIDQLRIAVRLDPSQVVFRNALQRLVEEEK